MACHAKKTSGAAGHRMLLTLQLFVYERHTHSTPCVFSSPFQTSCWLRNLTGLAFRSRALPPVENISFPKKTFSYCIIGKQGCQTRPSAAERRLTIPGRNGTLFPIEEVVTCTAFFWWRMMRPLPVLWPGIWRAGATPSAAPRHLTVSFRNLPPSILSSCCWTSPFPFSTATTGVRRSAGSPTCPFCS